MRERKPFFTFLKFLVLKNHIAHQDGFSFNDSTEETKSANNKGIFHNKRKVPKKFAFSAGKCQDLFLTQIFYVTPGHEG